MKIVDEMPTEGQFIKVWKFNDMLWSWTLKWHNGVVCYYDNEYEAWMATTAEDVEGATEIKYVI